MTVTADKIIALPAQLGANGVETSPLSLLNSAASADRIDRPQAMSAAVATAVLRLKTAIAGTSARSREPGSCTRRISVMTAPAQVTTAAAPERARIRITTTLGPAGFPPISRAVIQTKPNQPSGASAPA